MSLARARPSRRSQAAKAAPSSRQGKARPTRQVSSLALRSGAGTHPSLFVQAKLEVNQPGDRYERQADAVAGRVMRMALSPGEEPREDLALAQNPRALQRAPASPNTPSVSASTASAIRNPGPGQALSPGMRSRIEPHLGANLGNVRVHSGPAANQAAASLQARAFTHQNHIFLRSSAQSGNLGLMAHEAAHVVQQGAAPVQRAPANMEEPPEVQRSLVDDLVEGAGAVADTVSGALVDAAGAVVDMGADFFWSTLETIAPGFAPILRQIQQEGILGYLGGPLRGALGRVFDSLTGEPGAFDQLVGVFSQLAGQVGGILTALLSGDCQPLLDAVGQLKAMLEQIGSDVWNGITDFFRPIGEFFSGLWQQFGAPVVDWLKATAGEVWQEIQDLGGEIWAWTQPFRDDLAAGWNWVKEQLFGSAEGGEADSAESSGGLVGWITDKAGQAWGAIQAELEPAIAPIQGFADSVVAFLPMAQILSLRETVTGFLGDATSLTERLGQPQDVVENQDTLRDEILPGVLTTIVSVREGLVTAGGWLSAQIGLIAQTVTGMIDSLRSNGILGAVAGAIGWVQEAVGRIYAWQQTAVVTLFTGISEGLGYLSQFIEPVFNALQQVVTVLGDLVGQIGGFITGIWTRIPACIREPLMKFLTEQIFSRIPLFDQFMKVPDLFARVAQTALTILRKVFVDGDLLGAMWTYFSALLELLGLPPDLILRIITKAATAFSDIINDPIGFFINLLKALKQGFVQFFGNIFKHLLSGVTNWLFGQLAEAGISPPADLSLGSIIQFILDVLGLTIDNLFERLGNKIGREKAERIRAAFALATGAIRWIYRLVTEGPGALWEELKGQLSNLVTLVLDSVVSWMTKVIIARATVYLLGLMDPTFIMSVVNSLIAIYNVIETFVRYMRQILETVESVLDGIGGIARGALGQAAGFVEASLVRSLPIVIAFLASLLGLGGLGRRIGEMVESVRGYVNQAIDWLIDKGLALFNALLEGGKAVVGALGFGRQDLTTFESSGETHHVYVEEREGKLQIVVASNHARSLGDLITYIRGRVDEIPQDREGRAKLETYMRNVEQGYTDLGRDLPVQEVQGTPQVQLEGRQQKALDKIVRNLADLFKAFCNFEHEGPLSAPGVAGPGGMRSHITITVDVSGGQPSLELHPPGPAPRGTEGGLTNPSERTGSSNPNPFFQIPSQRTEDSGKAGGVVFDRSQTTMDRIAAVVALAVDSARNSGTNTLAGLKSIGREAAIMEGAIGPIATAISDAVARVIKPTRTTNVTTATFSDIQNAATAATTAAFAAHASEVPSAQMTAQSRAAAQSPATAPAPAPTTGLERVEALTWATGAAMDKESNTNHAERHFYEWFKAQDPITWAPRVKAIEIHNDPYSPCGACASQLTGLLNAHPNITAASLYWSKRYQGMGIKQSNSTFSHTLAQMQSAGWYVHPGPSQIVDDADQRSKTFC